MVVRAQDARGCPFDTYGGLHMLLWIVLIGIGLWLVGEMLSVVGYAIGGIIGIVIGLVVGIRTLFKR